MHVTLLVPDLFWPRDDGGAAYRDLKLPALERLLARARCRHFPPLSLEAWLCQAFEVERQQDWPVAAITLEFDGGDPGGDYWLRADPVHFLAHRDHLTLLDAESLDPSAEEAGELTALLTRHFAADGLAFHAPHPRRWYVRAQGTLRLATRELSQATGRDIAGALPTGEDSLRWRRRLTEIQMLFHEHPVNQRRESRGELPINSLWLWGGGRRPPVPGHHFSHVAGNHPLALALGARIGAATVAGDGLTGVDRATRLLIVADTSAARVGDVPRWQLALGEAERAWFAPLLQALRRRALEGIAIVALHPRGCRRFELSPADLLKFWRVARPLPALAPVGPA